MSLRRSLAWAFSGQFLAFLIQFAGLVVISRLLSPREIGTYAIAMAALGVTQVFTTFGVTSFVVREAELTPATLKSAFTVNTLLTLALSALLMAVSVAAGPLLGASEAGAVLRVLALSNLFAILNFRPSSMLQREMRFKQLSIVNVVNVGAQTTGTIGFALAGFSYMSAAYAAVPAVLAVTILTQILGRRHIGFGMSLQGWRPITTFGLQIMSINGIAMLNGKISELLVGRLLGVTALGYYVRASQVSSIIFDNLYGTATRVVFVQLARHHREGGDWQRTYLRSFAMIIAFMWPLLLGTAILSGPATNLLYGPQWMPAAMPLAAFMIAQMIGVAFGMNWELFVLRGETARQSRLEVARFLIGIPIFAVACFFSIYWAAIAKIVDAAIGLAIYYPEIRRLARLDGKTVPGIYRNTAFLAVLAVTPATVMMMSYDWSAKVPGAALLAAVSGGVALWIAAIFAMKHPLGDEFALVWRRVRLSGQPLS